MNFWGKEKKKNLNSLENSISLTVKQVFCFHSNSER